MNRPLSRRGQARKGPVARHDRNRPRPHSGARRRQEAADAPRSRARQGRHSKPAGAAAKLAADELAAIKELPKAEQDVAIAQAVCPVSTHNLGSMGKPLKVTAEGRTFYICCDSCEKEFKTDPKAVIAKLDKLKAGK